jgi:hypothetical protein
MPSLARAPAYVAGASLRPRPAAAASSSFSAQREIYTEATSAATRGTLLQSCSAGAPLEDASRHPSATALAPVGELSMSEVGRSRRLRRLTPSHAHRFRGLRPLARTPTDQGRPRSTLRFRPHLDRQGGAATAKGAIGTVDLAEEDHNVVWVRSGRLQASHDRGKKRALPVFRSP